MDMTISFPGGKRVDATFLGHVIHTDQAKEAGGDGSAPEPFATFLASIGTCAGIYVLGFCQARGLPTDGIRLVQHNAWNPVTHKLEKIRIDVLVPPGFPAKYHAALQRVADMCAVKKTILEPPTFEVSTIVEADRAAASAGA
jgi:ribosomal protein S12 methylthiotransferase accessory factor